MKALLPLSLALLWMSGTGWAAPQRVVEVDGVVRSYTPGGDLRWQVECQGPCEALTVEPSGRIRLGNRHWISTAGRVLPYLAMKGPLGERNVGLGWEEPADLIIRGLFPDESAVFDSNGNAWVVASPGTLEESYVDVVRSQGHTNVWTTERIYTTNDDLSFGATVIDGTDVVTSAWRRVGGTYYLEATRYHPGSGWGTVEIIHEDQSFFQTVSALADYVGNAVVGFDGDGSTGMWTVIFNVTTQTWGEAARLSLAGENVVAPTLVSNAEGTALYAVYWSTIGPTRGIYASRFDSVTASWGAVRRLPGSAAAALSGANDSDAEVPAAVDGAGNLTVLYYRELPAGDSILVSSRLKANGMFAIPRPVALGPQADLLDETAALAANEFGDLMLAYARSTEAGAEIMAARYSGATERWEPQRRIWSNDVGASVLTTSFLQDGMAVVAFLDAATDLMTSRLFNGTAWQQPLLDVPGSWEGVGTIVSARDGDDVLLLFDAGPVYATWLRGGKLEFLPSRGQ